MPTDNAYMHQQITMDIQKLLCASQHTCIPQHISSPKYGLQMVP